MKYLHTVCILLAKYFIRIYVFFCLFVFSVTINGETSLHNDVQPNPELFSFHSCMTDASRCPSKTSILRILYSCGVILVHSWLVELLTPQNTWVWHSLALLCHFWHPWRGHLVSCVHLTFILALPSGCFCSQSEMRFFLGSLPKEHWSRLTFSLAVSELRFILTCVDSVRFTPRRAGEHQLLPVPTWMFAAPWWHLS